MSAYTPLVNPYKNYFQSNNARNMGIYALPLLMSTVKPSQIAQVDLSATFLAVRAQGGGYCGSFFVVAAQPGVAISGVDRVV